MFYQKSKIYMNFFSKSLKKVLVVVNRESHLVQFEKGSEKFLKSHHHATLFTLFFISKKRTMLSFTPQISL